MHDGQVLVLPRSAIRTKDRFVPWDRLIDWLSEEQSSPRWLDRKVAESSDQWVQPIPSAYVIDALGRFLVARRQKEGRADMRARLSLVFGGHVDQAIENTPCVNDLEAIFAETVRRELQEELEPADIEIGQPLACVIDASTMVRSRHIAVIFEARANKLPRPRAGEEFSMRSEVWARDNDIGVVSQWHRALDPWSMILFEELLVSRFGATKVGERQIELPLLSVP